MRAKIPGLDGLRGIAAMIVLLSHMSAWGYNLLPGMDFRGIGRSAVVLFFVLSSFLLASQILNWAPDQLLNLRRWFLYLEARVLRIWPLYLVVLATALLTHYVYIIPILWKAAPFLHDLPVTMTLVSLERHLLLMRGEDILWTIPVEFKFYLVLPLLMLAILIPLRDRGVIPIVILCAAVLMANWMIPVASGGVETLPFIGVFLAGILLAFVHSYSPKKSGAILFHPAFYEVLAWACVVVFIILIPSVYRLMTGMNMPIDETRVDPLFSTLWSFMMLFMLRGSGSMRAILESRPLVFLGKISFSLYLWHRIPIRLMHRLTYYHFDNFLPQSIKAGIILVGAIVIAHISYRTVERPILNWRTGRRAASVRSSPNNEGV